MRFIATIVAALGFASTINSFATPPTEMLARTSRDTTVDPCTLANSPAVNASLQLSSWLECQINGFFPYPANGAWDKVFAQTFSPHLLASFNDTHRYNYNGWLKTYRRFNESLGPAFAPFRHGFTSTIGIPNANGDKGGTVYAIGWEGGLHTQLKKELWFSDAVFAVVRDIGGGKRRVVEFRESSNMRSTVEMPRGNEWECGFERR